MTPRPHARRYVRCLLCDKSVTINNFTVHVQTYHPASRGVPRRELFDELDEAVEATLPAVRAKTVRAAEGPAVVPPAPSDLPPLGPDDLDEIVLAVVGQVSERIPVEFLPAVFAWREATASFLRAVRDLA